MLYEHTTTTSGLTLIWDMSLDHTAQAVHAINPQGHQSWEDLRDYMVSLAGRNIDKPTWFGTGGWYVVAMPWEGDPPGTLHALCTVMAYAVNCYLAEK